MKKLLFIFLFLALNCCPVSAGQDIVVVQGIEVKPYDDAINGFSSVCRATIRKFVLSELNPSNISAEIHKKRPDMILAIGTDALLQLRQIKDIPIVYVMVLNPLPIIAGCDNVTGISMNIPVGKQLNIFMEALTDMRRLGLLYDPARTGYLAKRIKEIARENGIELIAAEVNNPGQVPLLVRQMKGQIDAFWMLPDVTVITPETVEFLLLFSIENKTPILAFSEKYVCLGALMSIGIDAVDMGRQAGEMAQKILSGKKAKDIERVDARKAVVSISLKIARKLGVQVNEAIIRKARIID